MTGRVDIQHQLPLNIMLPLTICWMFAQPLNKPIHEDLTYFEVDEFAKRDWEYVT